MGESLKIANKIFNSNKTGNFPLYKKKMKQTTLNTMCEGRKEEEANKEAKTENMIHVIGNHF